MKTNITKESKSQSVTSRFFLVMMFVCIISLVEHATCSATTVGLEWDAVANPALIIGYKVYYQADPFTGPWIFHASVDKTLTSTTISALDPTHSYHLAVSSYDATSESSYSNVVYVPKLSPPAISFTSPANNAMFKNDLPVAVYASAEVSKVEFYINNDSVPFISDTVAPYTFTWNTSSISNGTYTLTAKAYGSTGSLLQSALIVVTKDTIDPTISVLASISAATASGTLTVTAIANDDVSVSRVEFYDNNTLVSTVAAAPYIFNWNSTTADPAVAHSLMAKAFDAAGNFGQSSNVRISEPSCKFR